jgi:hypothetical protein
LFDIRLGNNHLVVPDAESELAQFLNDINRSWGAATQTEVTATYLPLIIRFIAP